MDSGGDHSGVRCEMQMKVLLQVLMESAKRWVTEINLKSAAPALIQVHQY